jgi:hypothetical protein
MHAHFVNGHAVPFDRRQSHCIRAIDQPFDDIFHKGLHTRKSTNVTLPQEQERAQFCALS